MNFIKKAYVNSTGMALSQTEACLSLHLHKLVFTCSKSRPSGVVVLSMLAILGMYDCTVAPTKLPLFKAAIQI